VCFCVHFFLLAVSSLTASNHYQNIPRFGVEDSSLLRPSGGVWSIVTSMSVCLFVRLSVCPFAHLEKHTAEIRQIFVHVACGRSSVLSPIRYVLPVLWITSRFHTTGSLWCVMRMFKRRERNSRNYCINWCHQILLTTHKQVFVVNCATTAKSAIYDCLVSFLWFLSSALRTAHSPTKKIVW